jgi:hypothetical protein
MTKPNPLDVKLLATRFCLAEQVVSNWMRAHEVETVLDLRTRYPGKEHDETMRLACDDIWRWARAEYDL